MEPLWQAMSRIGRYVEYNLYRHRLFLIRHYNKLPKMLRWTGRGRWGGWGYGGLGYGGLGYGGLYGPWGYGAGWPIGTPFLGAPGIGPMIVV